MLKKQFYNLTFLLLKESRFDKLEVNFWFFRSEEGTKFVYPANKMGTLAVIYWEYCREIDRIGR